MNAIHPEKKNLDYRLTGSSASPGNAVIYQINNISQGTDNTQRIGEKINCTSLMLRFVAYVNINTVITDGSQFVRLVIFYDSEYQGSVPAMQDVITGSGGSTTDYLSMMNIESYPKRFKVLVDKVFNVSKNAGGKEAIYYKRYIKLRFHEICFNGTGFGSANGRKGSILYFVTSNDVTNPPTFDIATRIRFVDF